MLTESSGWITATVRPLGAEARNSLWATWISRPSAR